MTRMLASVANMNEAEIALAGGADIIDFKDPATGALGAVSLELMREMVGLLGGQRETSAVCGDQPMQPEILRRVAKDVAATGVDYVKLGFFPSEQTEDCVKALAEIAGQTKLIIVLFADLDPDFTIIPLLAQYGFHGVMVDTADKAKGGLRTHFTPARIQKFVDLARANNLAVGLSGSLNAADIAPLLEFAPDFMGFRGALCGGKGRVAALDEGATRKIRALIPDIAEQVASRAAQAVPA